MLLFQFLAYVTLRKCRLCSKLERCCPLGVPLLQKRGVPELDMFYEENDCIKIDLSLSPHKNCTKKYPVSPPNIDATGSTT